MDTAGGLDAEGVVAMASFSAIAAVILDLTPAPTNRWCREMWLIRYVFTGEIYNFRELR
jgi:hypothetical protein